MNQFEPRKKEEMGNARNEREYREPGNPRASLITHKMISAISIPQRVPQEEGTVEKAEQRFIISLWN